MATQETTESSERENNVQEQATERQELTELQKLKNENERLRGQIESLMQQNWELRFDSLTGLERPLVYYTKINSAIEQQIKNETIKGILEGEFFNEADVKELKEISFTVTALDLGYLSKYNEDPEITKHYGGGHGGGDEILRQTASLIQEIRPATQEVKPSLHLETRGYRLGGDELGMIHFLKKEDAKRVVKEFKVKQGAIKLKSAEGDEVKVDMPPTINYGSANFHEAVEAFVKVFSRNERIQMDTETRYKTLQKFLTNIADRRAKRNKAYERIISMTNLLDQQPDIFKKNFAYLQKGALRLGEREFNELLRQKREDLSGFSERVREIVDQGLEAKHEEEITKAVHEYKAIVEIANRDEFT